jgi:hypothetical protein
MIPSGRRDRALTRRPSRVTMVSPDFAGARKVQFTYRDGRLTARIDGIRYDDVVVIE